MEVSVRFLGGAKTVTGSKFLVTVRRSGSKLQRFLVDAGLFQGARSWREKNWQDPEPKLLKEIDACLLTHAHIDHSGILPRFKRLGFNAPVYCTQPTREIAELLLLDSAMLQEEEAAFRAKENRSRHSPPLPLYTREDAKESIKLLKPVAYDRVIDMADGVKAKWVDAGHILGSASIRMEIGDKVLGFSGDLGRFGAPLLRDPETLELGDLLLIESTYGDRLHGAGDARQKLAACIQSAYRRGGVVLIPAFAVGRTQTLLYYLRELKENRQIPDLPVIVDSPMASDVTEIYGRHPASCDEETNNAIRRGAGPFNCSRLHFVRERRESIALNSISQPMIIISASGMLSGGRVLHHLRHRIGDERNTILFAGYQPPGGRGAWIKSGAKSLTLFKEEVPIRAQIEDISAFSAHADQADLLKWCRQIQQNPGRVAVVHGEADAAAGFSQRLSQELGWSAFVPEFEEEVRL